MLPHQKFQFSFSQEWTLYPQMLNFEYNLIRSKMCLHWLGYGKWLPTINNKSKLHTRSLNLCRCAIWVPELKKYRFKSQNLLKYVILVQHSHHHSDILHGANVACHTDADVASSIPLHWLTNRTHLKTLFLPFLFLLSLFFSFLFSIFLSFFCCTSGGGMRSSGAPASFRLGTAA